LKKSVKRRISEKDASQYKSDFNLKSSLNNTLGKYSDLHFIIFVFPSLDSDVIKMTYSAYSCRHSLGFTPNSFFNLLVNLKFETKILLLLDWAKI